MGKTRMGPRAGFGAGPAGAGRQHGCLNQAFKSHSDPNQCVYLLWRFKGGGIPHTGTVAWFSCIAAHR